MAAGRDEINRINVFPVPDGDTGTNFSLTLRAVADALRALGDASLPETARTMARAAVLGARGNSGMMLAHFLLGFTEALGDRATADAPDDRPRPSGRAPTGSTSRWTTPAKAPSSRWRGTRPSPPSRSRASRADIGEFMRRLLEEGEAALARTPELMAVLKEAGVVDAGGKGFVRMLEGVVRYIDGDPDPGPRRRDRTESAAPVPAALVDVAAERDFQFCTEVLVRGDQLPPANEVRAAMHAFGGSTWWPLIGRHSQDPCAHRYP